jgi:hypothetical protein
MTKRKRLRKAASASKKFDGAAATTIHIHIYIGAHMGNSPGPQYT